MIPKPPRPTKTTKRRRKRHYIQNRLRLIKKSRKNIEMTTKATRNRQMMQSVRKLPTPLMLIHPNQTKRMQCTSPRSSNHHCHRMHHPMMVLWFGTVQSFLAVPASVAQIVRPISILMLWTRMTKPTMKTMHHMLHSGVHTKIVLIRSLIKSISIRMWSINFLVVMLKRSIWKLSFRPWNRLRGDAQALCGIHHYAIHHYPNTNQPNRTVKILYFACLKLE